MIPSERLKGIEAFVLAADLGSFTAASQKLNLTVSAVSKNVGRLETRLDTRLFERTTRKLTLTDQGSAFYDTCVRVLGELESAEAVLAAHSNKPVGRIRLNVPVAFGRMQVMPLVLAFAEHYPGIRPEVSFTDRFVDVLEDGIDVAVRVSSAELSETGLGHRHLGSERLIFCSAPSYLKTHGTPVSIEALLERDLILYGRSDGSPSPWRFGHADGSVEQRTMTGRMVLGSAEAQVEAVKAGFGIAQFATWLIKAELERGELVEILPNHATSGLRLQLIWPRSRQLTPKVDALIALFSDSLQIEV